MLIIFKENEENDLNEENVPNGEGGEESDEDSEDDGFKITIDHDKIDEAKTSYQVTILIFTCLIQEPILPIFFSVNAHFFCYFKSICD